MSRQQYAGTQTAAARCQELRHTRILHKAACTLCTLSSTMLLGSAPPAMAARRASIDSRAAAGSSAPPCAADERGSGARQWLRPASHACPQLVWAA